jgi:DmsE family decaheme c-type cytochrome
VRAAACLSLALLAVGPASSQDSDDEASDPEYSRRGADSCFACHDDQLTLAVFRTPHAMPQDPRSPFGHGQLQCEACHGPSGDHAGRVRRGQERPPSVSFGSGAATPVTQQNEYCIDCHQNDTGFGWHGSEHDDNTVACADCHTSHAARDPVLHTSTQAEVCFDCHQQQRTQSIKPYAHPVRQGKMDCSGCHNTHGQTTELLLARQTLNRTCYDCHAEVRGPYLWEHAPVPEDCTSGLPSGVPSQYLLGQNCMNCHNQVHGSNHPSGSKLMR